MKRAQAPTRFILGDVTVDVQRKDIRNIYVRVVPPAGAVRMSVPRHLGVDAIQSFLASRSAWIRKQRERILQRPVEPLLQYVAGETIGLWGRSHPLDIVESGRGSRVELHGDRVRLATPRDSDRSRRHAAIEKWYREQVRGAAPPLIARWEGRMHVRVRGLFVRRMKTMWGSCNYRAGTIRLNTELAKKPTGCFEYVIVHELVHLLEPSHNQRFYALMGKYLPDWRHHRELLNRLPLQRDEWGD